MALAIPHRSVEAGLLAMRDHFLECLQDVAMLGRKVVNLLEELQDLETRDTAPLVFGLGFAGCSMAVCASLHTWPSLLSFQGSSPLVAAGGLLATTAFLHCQVVVVRCGSYVSNDHCRTLLMSSCLTYGHLAVMPALLHFALVPLPVGKVLLWINNVGLLFAQSMFRRAILRARGGFIQHSAQGRRVVSSRWEMLREELASLVDGGSEVLAGPSPLAVPGYNRRCRAASHAVATNWCSSFSEVMALAWLLRSLTL
ncbi:unnamed protein product [Effrenium voratum]|nr:unnamed protein product [Effrenium voratum]